jgi:hypothetical protein
LHMARLVWAILLAVLCAMAQRVEGTVIDTSTGNGIPGVTVELVRGNAADTRARAIDAMEGKALYSASTDAQGRFRLDDVQDGSYTARYRAPNYLDETWAPKRDPAPPAIFQVNAASGNPVKLEARMIHYGRMTGRLVDDKGHGVPNAFLLLSSGQLGLGANTDKDGKFSLLISPGVSHTLVAIPQLGWKTPDPEAGGGVRAWSRTYYPGVADPEAAQKITLPPGGELLDVEMKLAAVPAHAVRGVLLNPDGTPVPKTVITLGVEAPTPAVKMESNGDGTFEFPAVAEGAWRASAEVEREGVKFRALEWIRVSDRDLEGVKLQLHAPFSVRLRMDLETPEGWKAPKPPLARLALAGLGPGASMEPPLPFRTEPDGTFRLEPVYPGVYRFHPLLSVVPPGYYLDSVRLGDAVLRAPDVELSSGATPLILAYKTGGGTVHGTVENCAMGGVVLEPQDPALRWPAAIRTGRCDSKDHYEIPTVRPGDYYAQAFPPDGASELWQPKFDEDFVNQAGKVTVRAGESATLDLRPIVKR